MNSFAPDLLIPPSPMIRAGSGGTIRMILRPISGSAACRKSFWPKVQLKAMFLSSASGVVLPWSGTSISPRVPMSVSTLSSFHGLASSFSATHTVNLRTEPKVSMSISPGYQWPIFFRHSVYERPMIRLT